MPHTWAAAPTTPQHHLKVWEQVYGFTMDSMVHSEMKEHGLGQATRGRGTEGGGFN